MRGEEREREREREREKERSQITRKVDVAVTRDGHLKEQGRMD